MAEVTVLNTTQHNLSFWESLEKTDPKFTKRMTTGAKLTSINAEYQFQKMTALFGPVGLGWGYEIVRSEIIDCGPCWRQWSPDESPIEDGRVQVHTCHVVVWYVTPEDQRDKPQSDWTYHRVNGIGHTPFRYQRTDLVKNSDGKSIVMQLGAHVDMEYEKKSVTDAITKAMGFLGMSADVRMGMFDLPDYVEELRDEAAIQAAEAAEENAVRARHEFEDFLVESHERLMAAKDIRDLEIAYKPALIRIQRQGTKQEVEEFTGLKTTVAKRLIAEARAKEASNG